MDWNKTSLDRLSLLFLDKHYKMGLELRTDRKNLSEHWNRHVEKHFGITIIRDIVHPKLNKNNLSKSFSILNQLFELINFKNDLVKDAVIIKNPDRHGQYLVVPGDVAERILVFGMF
jgi:hypothetical protein